MAGSRARAAACRPLPGVVTGRAPERLDAKASSACAVDVDLPSLLAGFRSFKCLFSSQVHGVLIAGCAANRAWNLGFLTPLVCVDAAIVAHHFSGCQRETGQNPVRGHVDDVVKVRWGVGMQGIPDCPKILKKFLENAFFGGETRGCGDVYPLVLDPNSALSPLPRHASQLRWMTHTETTPIGGKNQGGLMRIRSGVMVGRNRISSNIGNPMVGLSWEHPHKPGTPYSRTAKTMAEPHNTSVFNAGSHPLKEHA